jgi:hypothetical protein
MLSAILILLAACSGAKQSTSDGSTAPPVTGISFAPRVDFATGGTNSGSIALADFNGDGKLDIAVSNFNSNTISVFLNKGDGTFGSPVVTTIQTLGASNLGAIVSGDFNEDGKTDLIVATVAGSQSDIVLLGNGDGSFAQADPIPNSFGFFQGRVADLNGDKHLDLVAGGNGNMTVALGKGDGTFSPAVYLPNGPLINAYLGIDLGDVTGDKELDIVGADFGGSIGDINVFLGNGDGTFDAPIPQSAELTQPDSVALADFNGDGKLDLLIGFSPGSAEVALGNGDGTFNLNTPIVLYVSSEQGSGIIVRVADFDQDGKPDALVADYVAGIFRIYLNNGANISSGSTYSYTIAPGLADVAIGDLNGDGVPDVVLVNNKTNMISVFLSQHP